MFDLAPQMPPVDWSQALRHLPEADIIKAVNGPNGIFADRAEVSTGGAMIKRAPNDDAWYRGGLWHDDMKINIPGFWFMSWYDVSVGPNLAAYNYVRRTASPEIADQQYAVIAPTLHCGYKRATENTIVGERSMGDARLDYDELTYGWFDHFLKGEDNGVLQKMPRVRYYTMGMNKWQSSDTWPPRGTHPMTLYLGGGGKANTLAGDGALTAAAPPADSPDTFTYDPMDPVPSFGGNVCCTGNAVTGGAFDQRKMEARPDILVYTSEPLKQGMEASGPIEVTLYVSSDAKDTDVTVKLIDVLPDGTAYNLDETIVDGKGQGIQGDAAADDYQQLLRRGTPDSARGVEQQLPEVRPQPEYRRQQLRREQGRGGAQFDPPLDAVRIAGDVDGEVRRAERLYSQRRTRTGS
jgi:hypothetical protein